MKTRPRNEQSEGGRMRCLRHRARGFTMVEVLIASLIVGVCMAAIVSMWSFSFQLGANADRQSTGYSLGRHALEEVKQTGFQDTAEGTSVIYYDSQGGSRSATRSSNHTYSVTTIVSSTQMNGAVPASNALRTVTITVNFLATSASVFTCSTYLARAGI